MITKFKRGIWYKFDKDDISTWPELHKTSFFGICPEYFKHGYYQFSLLAHGIKDDKHVLYFTGDGIILESKVIDDLTHWRKVPKSPNWVKREKKNNE